MEPKFKRVLLKISGEALAGDKHFGFDYDFMEKVVGQLVTLNKAGVEVGVVVGGGNFWRGRQGTNLEHTTADYMGMLATTMNALALQDAIEKHGVPTRVQSAIDINKMVEPYVRRKAARHLEKGRVVIFACGTGCPFFSTDTAAALRAVEIDADIILLAKNVDGIYDSDPKVNPSAKKYDEISYMDFISEGLKAMDTTAVTICMENKMPVLAFGLDDKSIIDAVEGKSIGTWIR